MNPADKPYIEEARRDMMDWLKRYILQTETVEFIGECQHNTEGLIKTQPEFFPWQGKGNHGGVGWCRET